MHVKVALPQRYMFTAMNLVRLHLDRIATSAFAADPEKADRARRALARALDMELAIMLETYREEYTDRVQRVERRERAELEARLAVAQARYIGIVENAAALVVATDEQNRVLVFNSKAESVTGLDRSEVFGADCLSTLCHPASRDTARAALDDAAAGRPVRPFLARLVATNNEERWVHWHVTRLIAEDAHLTCLIGIDVTDERALERRTRRAEQLAALGTLAAGLAHEIRNPLNAAQLQLMLVERRLAKPGDEHRSNSLAAARVVKNELGRLGGLVQDFLAFARPSELRLEQADLAATLANVAQLVAPAAAEAGVELIAPDKTHSVHAMYDEERMKQVLLNLMRNAVEAADRGGEVRIGIESDGSQTTIEVEDTGPGLPEGVNVFEPFATTKDGGTGLGLPIVHRIVSDHGGAVDVARRGERTIFAVHLPIAGP
jgi:PAS domain S-box-containing protein